MKAEAAASGPGIQKSALSQVLQPGLIPFYLQQSRPSPSGSFCTISTGPGPCLEPNPTLSKRVPPTPGLAMPCQIVRA